MSYKTKEDLDRVIKLGKSEKVVKSFFGSYKQGLAYQEFLDNTKIEYAELYLDVDENNETIKYIEYSSYKEEIDNDTQEVLFVPDVEENEGNLPLKPTYELFLNNKIEKYVDIEITNEEFNEFYKPYAREILNTYRNKSVEEMIVSLTINDVECKFNGNEKSQDRLNRALSVLENDNDTTIWIDENGDDVKCTKSDLKTILKLSGTKQMEIFVECAENKRKL